MKVLVTGAAGFIGAAMVSALLKEGFNVVGLDNINDYYDQRLKLARLSEAGITAGEEGKLTSSTKNAAYRFVRMDLTDRAGLKTLFDAEGFSVVVNLAGQAGVRYSIENPFAYIDSNIVGFLNILENCRWHPVRHLLYASSSSVYGMSDKVPYAETDMTDSPVSLYAATKKSNELMAYAYSNLYGVRATGLRFFTVYGPWGRPDMAPLKFMRAIIEGEPIRVFNHGDMLRDFTYIDDIVGGLMRLLLHMPAGRVPHSVYNIGHGSPVRLMDFIHVIEATAHRKAQIVMEGMQKGDVYQTYADTRRLEEALGYKPQVGIEEGITRLYAWYRKSILAL